ncbi:hypothetical protein BH11PLA2_BH11PLA2_52070 [soil metagenome]
MVSFPRSAARRLRLYARKSLAGRPRGGSPGLDLPNVRRNHADRLQQLSTCFITLRERVRDAVASEMGKAAGEALRDLLTAVLSKSANAHRMAEPQSTPRTTDHHRWDDDDEPHWNDEPRYATSPDWQSPAATATHSPSSPAMTVGLGVSVTRWLLQRRVPIWAGLLAGFATLFPHPLIQTGLGVVAAAVELLAITEFTSNSP